ncbi:MAG: MarR family winged helix-turn-helix transcriptional regulator [Candidatus Dormibacteraceae bacterium]
MTAEKDADDVDETARAWLRERPGTPVQAIGIVTRIWRLAKLLGEERRHVLEAAGADAPTLDLLSVLRRSGPPYRLSTRELAERTRVTKGAISQRLTRAERQGLVARRRAAGRTVQVTLLPPGHALVEQLVDRVLGREADLIADLRGEQQAELAELLRTLLVALERRLGPSRHTQVGSR